MALLNKITIENCTTFDVLAENAATLAYHNFRWQLATLILSNTNIFCGMDAFIKSYNNSVIIGQSTFNPWFIESTSQFVLFIDNIVDLDLLLQWMKDQRFNNTGKYLIICNSPEDKKCSEHRAVKLFWKYRIADVVYIKYDSARKPSGYTFFQDQSCQHTVPFKLNEWDVCIRNTGEECCKGFFPMKFKNFHKCPLIVSTFEQVPYMMIEDSIPRGADGDLLRVIIEALNATLVIMSPRLGDGWGKLEENGTWTGSLGDVYYDWANCSMTSASITLRRFRYFQMSTNYNTVTLAWVTHPSSLEPSSFKLLRPYNVEARIGILIMVVLMFLAAIFFRTKLWKILKEKFHMSEVPNDILFNSWEICMGLPATRLPTRWLLSYCTLLWIWYCYLLRTLYQVYLINCLQNDFRLNDFVTIEDAIAAGYPFGGGLALKDYFIEYPRIYKDWKNVESSEIYPLLADLSNGLNYVLAMNYETARMFLRKPKRKLHILPQKILNSPTAIYFKKYSWLARSINSILTHLVESGLADKIYKENTIVKLHDEIDVAQPIGLEEFTGCYVILITGWIIASIAFVIEKYVHSRKTLSINRNPSA